MKIISKYPKSNLKNVTRAVIDCYRGNCELCTKYSFVCSEEKQVHRTYASTQSLTTREMIHPSESDINCLKKIIQMRFSAEAIKMTLKNTTQNKCESCMHRIKKSVPSQLTFKRNYAGRVHAAINSLNKGTAQSIHELCKSVGAPINSPNVHFTLAALKRIENYNTMRKKTEKYKTSRRIHRQMQYDRYDRAHGVDSSFYYQKNAGANEILQSHNSNEPTNDTEQASLPSTPTGHTSSTLKGRLRGKTFYVSYRK